MNPDFFRQFGFLMECLSPWKPDVLVDLSPLKFPEGGKDEGESGVVRGSDHAKEAVEAREAGEQGLVGRAGRGRKEEENGAHQGQAGSEGRGREERKRKTEAAK